MASTHLVCFGLFYLMKNQIFEYHQFIEDPSQQEITFFYDDNKCNVIFDQFYCFINDIYYCPFTGMMFEITHQNEVQVECRILTGFEINQMRDILFQRIKIFENDLHPRYFKFQINKALNTWNEVIELPEEIFEESNCYKVEDEIEKINRSLIYKNNITKPVHYVYLFFDTITQCHKIGHTNNVKTRYKTLLSDRNSIIEITSFILEDRNYAILLEKSLHQKFNNYRDIGEWFKFNDLGNQQIIDLIYEEAENLNYIISEVNEYESRNNII